eukprot:Skav234999  [mRNA]  locus=scaffold122:590492:590713:- [translate_table: standard]
MCPGGLFVFRAGLRRLQKFFLTFIQESMFLFKGLRLFQAKDSTRSTDDSWNECQEKGPTPSIVQHLFLAEETL